MRPVPDARADARTAEPQESAGRYRIAKLNTDENPRTASQFKIDAIPTMLIFKNGQLVDRITGLAPKQAIVQKLAEYLRELPARLRTPVRRRSGPLSRYSGRGLG